MKTKYYIAPNGKLYWDSLIFRKCCVPVDGVSTTEIFDSAFKGNIEEVLIPIEVVKDERQNVNGLEFVRLDLSRIE